MQSNLLNLSTGRHILRAEKNTLFKPFVSLEVKSFSHANFDRFRILDDEFQDSTPSVNQFCLGDRSLVWSEPSLCWPFLATILVSRLELYGFI